MPNNCRYEDSTRARTKCTRPYSRANIGAQRSAALPQQDLANFDRVGELVLRCWWVCRRTLQGDERAAVRHRSERCTCSGGSEAHFVETDARLGCPELRPIRVLELVRLLGVCRVHADDAASLAVFIDDLVAHLEMEDLRRKLDSSCPP
jgi:hypothetical protein